MKLVKNRIKCEKFVRYKGKLCQKIKNRYKKGLYKMYRPEVAEGRFELSTLRV